MRTSSRPSPTPTTKSNDDYVGWLGHPFDPEAFSLAAANAALQRMR